MAAHKNIDYSKWDKLDLSDDDDDSIPTKYAPKVSDTNTPQPDKPHEAQGSNWNVNNWHWEEKKLDIWGKERLKSLLLQVRKQDHEFEYKGSRLNFILTFTDAKIDGDVWTHIRKGKKIVGYNLECEVKWTGLAGHQDKFNVNGTISFEVVVDEPDSEFQFVCVPSNEITPLLKKPTIASVNWCIEKFIKELKDK